MYDEEQWVKFNDVWQTNASTNHINMGAGVYNLLIGQKFKIKFKLNLHTQGCMLCF